jgi:hypothetical protein
MASVDYLKCRARPVGYVEEMRAVAIDPDADPLSFDLDSAGYKAMEAKYRNYRPTDDDLRRAMHEQHQLQLRDYDADSSPESPKLAGAGCCGAPRAKIS